MKILITCVALLLASFQVFSQDKIPVINEVKADINPLDTLRFDAIVACNVNYDSVHHKRTYEQIRREAAEYDLGPRYTSSKRNVDPALFNDILKLFSDTATYGSNYADCFEPRFVLQFTMKGQERFRILICEGCGFLESSLPIPAAYRDYYDNQYEDEGKQVIYRRYLKGFSENGKAQINQLCKQLNLGYCME